MPRKVTFNRKCGLTPAGIFQWLMLINPVTWLLFWYGYMVVGEIKLMTNGVYYPATVTYVEDIHYTRNSETSVRFDYSANGKTFHGESYFRADESRFKVGHIYKVFVLPSEPSKYEPLECEPGTQLRADLTYFIIYLVINLALEAAIWLPSLKHKRLAQYGVPVPAKIERFRFTEYKGKKKVEAELSYKYKDKPFFQLLTVSPKEYEGLTNGSIETILCDPSKPNKIVFYKYCRYHPAKTNG